MKTIIRPLFYPIATSVCSLAILLSLPAGAANVTKLDTTSMAASTANWSAAPAATDVGEFTATPGSATLASLSLGGSDLTLGGLQLDGTLNGPLTIATGNTLTLGTSGINMSAANNNLTMNCTLTLGSGYQAWAVASGKTLTLNGTVSRAAGASMSFPTAGVTSTVLPTSNGIIGGWATVTGTGDWAATNSSGNVITYASYTSVGANFAPSPTANYKNTAGCGPSASGTVNSINAQFDFAIGTTTITNASGGIILGSSERWMTGTGGTLKSGLASGELFIHANTAAFANGFQIQPIIADNGLTPGIVIKDGNGQCELGNGGSTFSGGLYLNAGKVYMGANSTGGNGSAVTSGPLGKGTVTFNGGTLVLGGRANGSSSTSAGYTEGNNLVVPVGISAVIDGFAGNGGLNGNLSGGGTLTLQNTSVTSLSFGIGSSVDWSGFTNTLNYNPSGTSVLNIQGPSGNLNLSQAALNINYAGSANSSWRTVAGFTTKFGSLTGNAGAANANIQNAGTIEVGNLNTSTTFAGFITGAGSLTKVGTGTLTLSGVNTYTGPTTISAGGLTIGGAGQLGSGYYFGAVANNGSLTYSSSVAQTLAGSITGSGNLTNNGTGVLTLGAQACSQNKVVVKDGATLNEAYAPAAQLTATSLTVGTTTGATLGCIANSTSLARYAVGTLTLNGTSTINILGGNFVAGNTYPLITYTTLAGAGSYSQGTLPGGVSGSITTIGNTITLTVTAVTNTIWTGLVNGTWDINTTANWTNAGTLGTKYIDGSVIQFDDTGINTTTISNSVATTLTPGNILVTNNTLNYNFKANTIIAGNGGLTKTGTAALTNSTPNTYTGPTTINQGQVVVGVASVANVSGAVGNNSAVSLANDATAALNLNGFATQIGSLTGGGATGGNVALGAATLTVGGDNSSPAAYAGVITGPGGGLTKIGTGTLTLSGTTTYTNATVVSAGALNITGSALPASPAATTATMTIGNTVGNSLVKFSGTFLTNYDFNIGTLNGAVGALYQTAGTITESQGASGAAFQLGNAVGAYGYYYGGSGATLNVGEIGVGGESAAGNAICDINGANVLNTGWVVVSRVGGAQTGVLNVFSGLLTYAGGGVVNCWGAAGSTGIVNIMGGAVTNTLASVGFNLNQSGAANTAILNLDGGVAQGNAVGGGTSAMVNFNGGTLRASVANGSFMTGLGSANIYSGGGTINNNSFAITIAQPLLAPAGSGVNGISSYTGGAGYIAPPIVAVVRGTGDTTGVGATAIAQINPATGSVTNIVITSPGINYTVTPTFTLTGGGATTPATITGVAPVANTGGGMTFNGTAQTTLTGANTYTGGTTVSGGTVQITSDAQLGAVPASPAINITLNGGELYNNNSSPILNANRSILLGASGGYLQAGFGTNTFSINGLITGTGALGINWDSSTTVLNSTNNYQGDTTLGTTFGTWWNNAGANLTVRLGVDNALPYGAGVGNLNFGTSGLNNTATLDLNGHNLQLNGLNGSGANGIINNTIAGSYTVTVGNNDQTGAFAGAIKNTGGTVALTKVGNGTETLSGANTYVGNTTISAGTLALGSGGSISNSPNIIVAGSGTFDVSGIGFVLSAAQNLKGTGAVSGTLATVTGSAIYPAVGGTAGTMVFNSDLNQSAGGSDYFDLNTNYSTGNDQITVAGNLTLSSSDTIRISALHGAAELDTNADYVLFTVTSSTSMPTTPALVWDGTTPANYLHYSVVQSGNNVVLHYTTTQAPVVTAVANPATLTRNELTTITANVTPGLGGVASVTVDISQIGGSSAASLVQSNLSNVYTNTFAVAPTIGASTNSLTVTVTDNSTPTPLLGNYVITPVVVILANQVWNGAGSDAYADNNANWTSGAAPGYVGDGMTFAGNVNTSPDLDQAYTVSGLTFNANAGSFTLGSTANNPLTMTGNGPIAVNTTNAQTLNLVLADTGGGLTKTGNGPLILTANNTYTGLTSVQGGDLVVDGGGTLGITGAGGSNIEIAPNSSQVATLSVTNGTVNAVRVIIAGNSGNNSEPGTGVVNQAGGTINSYNWFTVGSGGTNNGVGTFNMSGGVLNVQHQQMEVGNFTNASGTVNLSGSSAINIWNNNALTLGANNYAGSGTFNQNGGTVTLYSDGGTTPGGTGFLSLGRAAISSGIFTYNLNGGVLSVPQVSHVSGTGNFYFNGGTLQASKDNAVFMTGLTAICVSTNGAIIDDGGHVITINQSLTHDPALGANADAGLTKQNSGTLTLSGSSTYTGNTTINGGTLQLSAPVLHMTFDNVSGTTVVNQGSGGSTMNGTLTGTATISTNAGRFGNALSIPTGASTAAYVLVSSSVVPLNYNGNWTVGMWLKTTTAGGAYLYQGAGAWASGNQTFYLNNGAGSVGSGTHAGGVQNSGGWVGGTAAINDGSWHFVVLTGNGGMRASYVDGALDALTINQWNRADTGTQVRIGGTGTGEVDGQVGLGGLIDEVYIYNRALSQAEIQQLYINSNPQVLPASTAVSIASGTLDIGGLSQQIGSLAGPGNVLLDDIAGVNGTLIVGNANSTSFDGAISDTAAGGSLVKVGTGALSLQGASSYGGSTTVSNGTLLVNGSLSGSGSVTVGTNATFGGLGSVNGPVTVNGGGVLSPGSNSIPGALTIYNNLTLAAGAACTFTLGSVYSSGNDQINMNGALVNNNINPVIHIKAPGTLDTTGDYVLINGFGSLSGIFNSTPVWDIQPPDYTHYTVVVSGSQVLLHYSATTGPTAGITINPATVSRNQNALVTVTVTNGYYPISTVTVDASGIGLSPTLALSEVGATGVWTNTIAATAGTAPNVYPIVATITDSGSQTATVGANLTVTLANDVWVGGGSDAFFDTNPNWGNSAAPGFVGDSLTFAGIVNTNPSMDLSYTVTGVTFSNNAGMFDITTGNGSILTLTANGVLNNSTNAQGLNVPLVMTSAQMLNAASGSLALSQTINNGGYILTVGGASNTVVSGAISGSGGLTKTNTGELILTGADTFTGNLFVKRGTVVVDTGGSVNDSTTWCSIGQDGNDTGALVLKGTGSLVNPFDFNVGDIGSAYGVLNVQDSATLTVSNLFIASANAAGSTASGTVNQTGGSVTQLNTAVGMFAIGGRTSTNGVAVYNMSGGTLTAASGIRVGGTGTGTFNQNGGMLVANGGVNIARIAGSTGTFNENGGTNTTLNITSSTGVNAAFNFNGGTVKPTAANTAFMTGLTAAFVSTNGAVIDSGGFNITIAQALNAPYYGVTSIAVTNGGSGYVSAPIVSITGGAGLGATAVATVAGGAVTGIIITSPGGSYNGGDVLTATLIGGGGSGAGLGTPVIAPVGSGSLTKNGTGTLTLTGGNSYTGGTVVNAGSLQITSDAQLGAAPGSPATNITLNGGAIYNNNSTPVLSATRTILLGAGGGYLQSGWQPQGQSFVVDGLITGAGGLGINWDASPVYLNAVNTYHGDTTIGTAAGSYWNNTAANPTLALGIDNALPYGAGAGNVVFGTSANNNTATLNLNGHNAHINGLTGGVNAIVDNTVANTTNVLTVGNNNQTSTFAGVIKNTAGRVALTKVGSGIVLLTGTNAYTGNTTVNGGTLGITQPTLATNSTVTVAGGAFLNLGFAVTNRVASLVLNGASQPAGVYNSTTASPYITGSGSLELLSTMASNPTNITVVVTGTTLSLGWPEDHRGWMLQSQTNSLSTGISVTNWFDVAGSDLVTNKDVIIDPTNPTVFYRLHHP